MPQTSLAAEAAGSCAELARFETGHPTASIGQLFRVFDVLNLSLDLTERTATDAEARVPAALAARRTL